MDEPEVGSVILASTGEAFQRRPDGWWKSAQRSHGWKFLNQAFAPVRILYTPEGTPMTRVTQTGWWTLDITCDLTDADREHIAEMIRDGFTEGQIVHTDEDEEPDTCDRCGTDDGHIGVDYTSETGYEGLCSKCLREIRSGVTTPEGTPQ